MVVISSRDFRSNQSKYLGMAANGTGVVLKTRSLGSFKIVPVTEDDTLMTKNLTGSLNHYELYYPIITRSSLRFVRTA